MPIDPSIPLSVQPVKLETPMNQLAMAGEMMKLGEYKQASEERNFLRNRMAQGNFDIANPVHRQEVMAGAPTVGGKFLSDTASMQKNLYQGEESKAKIEDTHRLQAVQQIIGANTPDAALAVIQNSAKNGIIKPEYADQLTKEIASMPYDKFQVSMIRRAVKPETLYTHETVSAGEKARLAQSAAQHADVQNRPQYIQTDAGLVAVPNVLKPGQAPVGVPVMGANGENLGKPLKDIPATVNKAIIENDISMNKANRALDLLQGKDVTTPKGDVIKGSADATGFWKGLTPQVILNKWDPGGVSTRAFVADIGSLKVHDRSGAAVTASETPRLKPFIPSIYDAPDVAAEKLVNFKAEYEDIQRGLTETYSKEQGYRPSPLLTGGKSSGGGAKPSLDSIFNPNPKQ